MAGTNHTEYALALDLGGTFIKSAVVSDMGTVEKNWKVPTEADQGGDHVRNRLVGLCRTMLEDLPPMIRNEQVVGLGIGSPGVFDYDTGQLVAGAVNLPGMSGTPLRAMFEESLGLPTRVDNDANAFALAEAKWGAGKGAQSLIAYTIGTGVGGGVVLNGQVLHGAWGFAGELGHVTVEPEGEPCPCGNRGCVEPYSSANGIANYARKLVMEGGEGLLAGLPPESITCKDVGDAARQGDALAISAVERAAYYLGIAIAAAVIVLNPEVVVIGGGGSLLGEMLFEPIRRHLLERVYHQPVRQVPVVGAKLGTDSGVIGAGALAFAGKGEVALL